MQPTSATATFLHSKSSAMEGPSLKILKEELRLFKGKKVIRVSGNTSQPKEQLKNRTLSAIKTWGKNLFLTFSSPRHKAIVTKTHFLMFGSYTINKPKPNKQPRLQLQFKNGTVYFYACSIRFDGETYWRALDQKVDLMSSKWDPDHVLELLQAKASVPLCDLFLDQNVFAGSGNIVKNEVLFNLRRHPLLKLSQINNKDWPALIEAVHSYCESFYAWKKRFELRQHWQVYRKRRCPLCDRELIREKIGRMKRSTFYCPKHQTLTHRKKSLLVYPVLAPKNKIIREQTFDH